MASMSDDRCGSFRAVRNFHLPMFDERLHRHDRGWPHGPEPGDGGKSRKAKWKTIGILHFRHEENEDG